MFSTGGESDTSYIGNPDFPLYFEYFDETINRTLPKTAENAKVDPNFEVVTIPLIRNSQRFELDYFIDKETYEATIESVDAWALSDAEEIIKIAKKSLERSTCCAEAYILLGIYESKNYETALQYFELAISAYKSSRKPKLYEETFKPDLFQNTAGRTLFYALVAKASVLRKMKRFKESLETFMILEKNIDKAGSTASQYINFRAKIPAVLAHLGKYKEALEYIAEHKQIENLTSCKLDWNLTGSLCEYNLYPEVRRDLSEQVKSSMPTNRIMLSLVNHSAFVPYFFGTYRLPHQRIPNMASYKTNKYSPQLVACYFRSNYELWKNTKGAVAWLIKNAVKLALIEITTPDNKSELISNMGLKMDFESFKFLLTKEFYTDDHSTEYVLINHLLIFAPNIYTEYYLEKGFPIHHKNPLTALHTACYYNNSPKIIDLLIKRGSPEDLFHRGEAFQTPFQMCLTQGNWKIFQYLMMKYPTLNEPNFRKNYLRNLVQSDAYFCLKGKDKCSRCVNDDIMKHSKDASFEKCIDVLIACGLQKNPFETDSNGYELLRYLDAKLKLIKAQSMDTKNLSCIVCGKQGILQKCSQCKVVHYCSVKCQSGDWALHKLVCKAPDKISSMVRSRSVDSKLDDAK